MDSNSDGVIDASDEAFGQLKVWQDADGVAEVDEGEMRSLEEAGITGFDLDSYKANLGTITRLNDEGDEVEEQIERLKIGAAELHGVLNYTKSSTDEDGAVETGIAGDVGFEYFRDGFRIDRDEDGGFDIVFEDGAQGSVAEATPAQTLAITQGTAPRLSELQSYEISQASDGSSSEVGEAVAVVCR